MAAALASIDGVVMPLGEATVPVTDPAFTLGWSVFETLRTVGGRVPRLPAHLDRLRHSAAGACLPLDEARVAGWIEAIAARHGGDGRLRVTLTAAGRCVITVEDVDPTRWRRPVRAVRGPHRDEPFLGGAIKHGSRAPWVVAVKRSGLDEVLLVDHAGRFTEGTSCAIVAVVDGTLVTAPHDGRILPSTTMAAVLRRAGDLGVPVLREGPPAGGPWDGLYVVSTTRWIAPVVELDGEALPGWEPVGRRLADADPDEEVP